MKAVVAVFNQEKALVGAFSVIVQLVVEPMDRFTALVRRDLPRSGNTHQHLYLEQPVERETNFREV